MIPQNNICPFQLVEIRDADILLIDRLYEVSGDLEYYENKYTGPNKNLCIRVTLKDFWNWIIREYLSHLE